MAYIRSSEIPGGFIDLIDESRSLIDSSGILEGRRLPKTSEPLASLLEQCLAITQGVDADQEPIRTIHHFACTGGTLFAKCLASMPNVQLLSEVAPYSQLRASDPNRFAPTDLIQLLRWSSRGTSAAIERETFSRGIETIYQHCLAIGQRLLIREHSHSMYCFGDAVLDAPGVREVLGSSFRIVSIVSVRHPLDSFLSLSKKNWLNFQPATLDEYARRYLAFLSDHQDMTRIRYEDFVDDPETSMRNLCAALEIPFREGFMDLFSVHRLSGDSGRATSTIGRRERRKIPLELEDSLRSRAYRELCAVLDYSEEVEDDRQPG